MGTGAVYVVLSGVKNHSQPVTIVAHSTDVRYLARERVNCSLTMTVCSATVRPHPFRTEALCSLRASATSPARDTTARRVVEPMAQSLSSRQTRFVNK